MTAANKTYDTTNTATLNNGSDTLRGVIAGHNNGGGTSDAVTLGTGTTMGTFASVNVGNGITVTTTGFTINGADAGDYTLGQPISTANITQASPIITWNNPANITYGTALSSMQLNASANVLGTFVYTPAAGTVPNAGSGQTLSVVFTPANTTDYATATHAVTINVSAPTVTFSNPGNQTSTAGSTASVPLMAYASNGDPLTYTATGLPPGLAVGNGTISGTIAGNAGSTTPYTVTITATAAQ